MSDDAKDLVALVREDANELLRQLPSVGGQSSGRPRPTNFMDMVGKTTSAGLPTTSEGDVVVHKPTSTGWVASTEIVKAWAWPTAIVGEQFVQLFVVDGRFVAHQVCP
jgi:hypothetical protein